MNCTMMMGIKRGSENGRAAQAWFVKVLTDLQLWSSVFGFRALALGDFHNRNYWHSEMHPTTHSFAKNFLWTNFEKLKPLPIKSQFLIFHYFTSIHMHNRCKRTLRNPLDVIRFQKVPGIFYYSLNFLAAIKS